MSKELEDFEEMYNWIYCNTETTYEDDVKLDKIRKNVKQALQRLESIDNANPSEAMECLEWLIKNYIGNDYYVYEEELTTIKQALLKAQEQDRVLEVLFEKRIDLESFYTSFIEENYDYNFYDIHYGTYGLECLTEEEFDLLKRYCDERYKNR